MRRNKFLLLFIWITIFSSCSDEDENDCDPEVFNYKWSQNKSIEKSFNPEFERFDYSVVSGENILIEYRHDGAQCDYIIDEEWGEMLTFEINKSLTSFEYRDGAIAETNCFYREYGAWVVHIPTPVLNGVLKGEKTAKNKWKIIGTITVVPEFYKESKVIKFSGIFKE